MGTDGKLKVINEDEREIRDDKDKLNTVGATRVSRESDDTATDAKCRAVNRKPCEKHGGSRCGATFQQTHRKVDQSDRRLVFGKRARKLSNPTSFPNLMKSKNMSLDGTTFPCGMDGKVSDVGADTIEKNSKHTVEPLKCSPVRNKRSEKVVVESNGVIIVAGDGGKGDPHDRQLAYGKKAGVFIKPSSREYQRMQKSMGALGIPLTSKACERVIFGDDGNVYPIATDGILRDSHERTDKDDKGRHVIVKPG